MDTREKQDAVKFLMRHVLNWLDQRHPVRKAFADAARAGCSSRAASRAYGLWAKLDHATKRATLNGWEWPDVRLKRAGPRPLMPALIITQQRGPRAELRSAVIRYAMVEACPDVMFSVPAGTPVGHVQASLFYLLDVVSNDWKDMPGINRITPDAVQFVAKEKSGSPKEPDSVPPESKDSVEARAVAAA